MSEALGHGRAGLALVPAAPAAGPPPDITPEPGSYRDRSSRVFYRDGRVLRGLSTEALANWRRLETAPFFAGLLARGRVVQSRLADPPTLGFDGLGFDGLGFDGLGFDGLDWPAALEHERIPFVSYPYEWTFGMLKDAALLHLELLREALASDMILKDASPYNVQWRGVEPVFIDIPSFVPLKPGEPWVGYRQFCELLLYPLMLQAYKGADYRPWLRGRIDGIKAEDMRGLLSVLDLMRPGVLLHVVAQNALQKRYGDSRKDVRGALAKAGFDKRLILRNVEKLARLVERLEPAGDRTEWADYERTHSYDEADLARKLAFVEAAAATRPWRLAWDLGCNTGTFSRILAGHAEYVLALDGDWQAIERLYRRQRTEASARRILPLVMNLADASPNQGWLGAERKGLAERGRPEITLCLALIHHLVIGANIPLADLIGWLRSLGSALVIEFVGREDEMVQALLANREDQHADYRPETFKLLLARHFSIEKEQELKGGKRRIYFALPKT